MKGKKEKKGRAKMTVYENHDTEYKEQYVSGIGKEVVAFANSDGGTLYIGVRDDGVFVASKTLMTPCFVPLVPSEIRLLRTLCLS